MMMHPSDRGQRKSISERKFINFLKKVKISIYDNNRYSYKSNTVPCSCYLCRDEKYNRRLFKKDTKQIMNSSL